MADASCRAESSSFDTPGRETQNRAIRSAGRPRKIRVTSGRVLFDLDLHLIKFWGEMQARSIWKISFSLERDVDEQLLIRD